MTRISKYPLDEELLSLINEEFVSFLSQASATGNLASLLEDLLTPTERVMLSKRIMIAILLTRGHNAETIKFRLNVSNSAILGVNSWLRYPHEGTKKAFADHNTKKSLQALIDKIESILDTLSPGKYTNWREAGKAKDARRKSRKAQEQLR